ncbi:MAG: cytochrome-c peroxidase, partial [Desulfobulbaceae bacterium]|nr:cytochrome-c peroxidase [Desulfobulbaceae bacterium]
MAEQALGPFLNPVEMAMRDEAAVVRAVLASRYVALFIKVFPDTASANVYETYDNIGV